VSDGGGRVADLKIGPGRYYVDGLLCENLEEALYFQQDHLPLDPEKEKLPDGPFLVYLDVWERHVTFVDDDGLREVALGGPDTATRAQVVWQVRTAAEMPAGKPEDAGWPAAEDGREWVARRQPAYRGSLKARAKIGGDDTNPCVASPDARYRGAENQLYRVEIQREERGPVAADGTAGTTAALTFKWSRENGSVVFPVLDFQGGSATLEHLGRDEASGLKRGDWVELADDDTETGARSWSLLRVEEVDAARSSVTLKPAEDDETPELPVYDEGEVQRKHAVLRRWDHRASAVPKTGPKPRGAVLVIFSKDIPKDPPKPGEGWVALEDGIEIQLQPGTYRPGDFWLIPARTATGDVEWPGPPEDPEAVPPHGVEHHYAPLALRLARTTGTAGGGLRDLRKEFKPLGLPAV
jgi:hypothetical protein